MAYSFYTFSSASKVSVLENFLLILEHYTLLPTHQWLRANHFDICDPQSKSDGKLNDTAFAKDGKIYIDPATKFTNPRPGTE